MQSSAESLTDVNEGSWMSDETAIDTSQGVSSFSCASMGAGGMPHLQSLPQVATMQDHLSKGSDSSPLSEQAQASAMDGEQPYFLDIFCGTAGVTAALKRLWS